MPKQNKKPQNLEMASFNGHSPYLQIPRQSRLLSDFSEKSFRCELFIKIYNIGNLMKVNRDFASKFLIKLYDQLELLEPSVSKSSAVNLMLNSFRRYKKPLLGEYASDRLLHRLLQRVNILAVIASGDNYQDISFLSLVADLLAPIPIHLENAVSTINKSELSRMMTDTVNKEMGLNSIFLSDISDIIVDYANASVDPISQEYIEMSLRPNSLRARDKDNAPNIANIIFNYADNPPQDYPITYINKDIENKF